MPPSSDFNDSTRNLPPQSLEAELGVLGGILLVNEKIDDVIELLSPSLFYNESNQKIYAAIQHMYDTGIRGIDLVTLAHELDRRSELEEIGGAPYLTRIVEAVPHAAHVEYYAKIVRDKAIRRRLIYACTDILKDCYESPDSTDEMLQNAERNIFQILEQQEDAGSIEMREILLSAWDRINERSMRDGASGLATGFVDMDAKTNGFQPSELIILAARPSMGKTALVCNWAEGVARENNKGVLLFSLEQSRLELAERFLCIQAKINGHKLRAGDIDEVERHQLVEASQVLSELPLYIDDKAGRTVGEVGAIARRIKRKDGLGLIIIDYLQLLEPEDKGAPREQQIAQMSRRLKFIAKDLEVPVIALSQLNRGLELREDKRPKLADLRESGAIEQDADIVCFLHRPAAYDPEDRPGEAEVIIAKNRSGPTGIVPLAWRAEYMRFENYTNVNEPEGGFGL
ncbi:Replicative DNA helicase [Polystyrenella longa]|uniref:Replicative DNA helicase n=1 Tax=Polystyrenella longa TaxID=2528007 RepID=A0A518CKF8_9PLAN|nr:replicative DNA helicase [Polystyrenella longa]QDU79710.1 Replicative DNA helicase [Polystyrenella longa]